MQTKSSKNLCDRQREKKKFRADSRKEKERKGRKKTIFKY